MAKKGKKVKEPELTKKELKAQAKALALAEQEKLEAKTKKKGKGKEPAKEPKKSKVSKAVAKEVEGDDWDESTGSGGDFFKLKSGKHIGRIRSVVSLGQVQFTFNKVLDDKATSALGLVIEVWSYEIKKGKVKITCDQPAIVYHVMKALNGNPKANYTKTKKALGIKSPDQFKGMAVGVELFTSDKGYMYVHGAITGLGLAEAKATPKLTAKGHCVPNLDKMTKEALLDLNPITQVKDYVLQAVNLEGTEAERIVAKIRKDKPEYAMLRGKPEDKSKGKGKKSKKKLSEDDEY
tara:strand:+ start:23262 stop:24140 length:879 start_codon:yes stop_codon:yes gene_type:complete